MNLQHFPYYDPTKKSAKKKYYKFQRHSLLTALHKKNLLMRTTNFLVLVIGHHWKIGLMKLKKKYK